MLPTETDVLIVGAGPTGLSLAIALQQAGVRHLALDRLPHGENTSRAAVIHSHTLDVLERIGVADELCGQGVKLAKFTIRDRDRALLNLRFDGLPSRHPHLLMVPQDVTERVLAERLGALGGIVHRGITVTGVEQHSDGVTITAQSGAGETSIRARYVVGADGMHSIVRKAAGIEFEGEAYGESFVLADVHMDWDRRDEVSLFFSPAGLVVVAPLPNGAYRIVATLDEAPQQLGVADVQALLDARGPTVGAGRVRDVVWSSRFRVHHRLASAYRSGRLLVMGDAAHVHSPAGGQGMNCGLVDAAVLGELLSAVVRGERPDAALDAYSTLRRPAASQVLALAGRLTKLATMRSARKRAVRNAAFAAIDRLPFARRKVEMNLSGLAREALAQVPH